MRLKITQAAYQKFRDSDSFNQVEHDIVTKKQLSDGNFVVYYDMDKVVSYFTKRRVKISTEDLKARFERLSRLLLASCGPKNVDITHVTHEDVMRMDEVVREIQKRQTEARSLALYEDLALDAEFLEDAVANGLRAWAMKKRGSRWYGPLVRPEEVANDLGRLQANGYSVIATEKAQQALASKLSESETRRSTAVFALHKKGFSVELSKDNLKVLAIIKERLTIRYKGRNDQILEYGKEEGRYKLVCARFALPAVLAILRTHRIKTLVGIEALQPPKKIFTKIKALFQCTSRQEKAFTAWSETKCATVEMPTGSGKTMVGIKAIVEENCWTLIVVPTIELIDHWKKELLAHTTIKEEDIGVYYGEKKQIRPVTIVTYQSGQRLVSDIDSQSFIREFRGLLKSFHLLILDEGHHGPANFFSKIMTSIEAPMRLNLTATIRREDGNESLAFLACGPLVFSAKYSDLACNQEVAPIRYQKVMVPLSIEETELIYWMAKLRGDYVKDTARLKASLSTDKDWAGLSEQIAYAKKKIRELYLKTPFGQLAQDPEKVQLRKIFGYTPSKFQAAFKILQAHAGQRVMTFNQLRVGAKLIHSEFLDAGFRNEMLIGGEQTENRRRMFADFLRGANSHIVTTTVLNEGVNVPDCQVGIIFNGSSSKLEMIQRMGRTARFKPGKISYIYELVAYVDHNNYEWKDSEYFSDYSTYEIRISKERDVVKEMGLNEMAICEPPAKARKLLA